MQQIDAANNIYQCQSGEKVIFSLTARNTDSRAFWRFEGSTDLKVIVNDTFTTPTLSNRAVVLITFDFINESGTGGSYRVELTGSAGGGTFTGRPNPMRQAGDKLKEARYVFEV